MTYSNGNDVLCHELVGFNQLAVFAVTQPTEFVGLGSGPKGRKRTLPVLWVMIFSRIFLSSQILSM